MYAIILNAITCVIIMYRGRVQYLLQNMQLETDFLDQWEVWADREIPSSDSDDDAEGIVEVTSVFT